MKISLNHGHPQAVSPGTCWSDGGWGAECTQGVEAKSKKVTQWTVTQSAHGSLLLLEWTLVLWDHV